VGRKALTAAEREERRRKRKEYLHQYYQAHKEKALEYQRNWAKNNRPKRRQHYKTWEEKQRAILAEELPSDMVIARKPGNYFTSQDIQSMSPEKAAVAITRILNGEAYHA